MQDQAGMIEAVAPTASVRRAYALHSIYYGAIVAPLESKPRRLALQAACIGPDERVLEVAVGPGYALREILKVVHPGNVVEGVDLSPRMLDHAERLVRAAGHTNFRLQEADAHRLPFTDASFDVLLNSYMLDLIPLGDISGVLHEFRRVLKPGGRLVLVNMSKPGPDVVTLYERLYNLLPRGWVPYLLGSCRPVLMEGPLRQAGFSEVQRQYLNQLMASEIVTARAP